MSRLTLLAQDAGDLPPLSALVQDALLLPADLAYDRKARRLVLLLNRFRWEAKTASRCQSALRVETVLALQQKHWPVSPETPLNLLSLEWAEPSLTLIFSEGISLRTQCEAVDLVLEDVSEPWPTARTPGHEA
jgi:hypothetical protein